MLLIIDLDSTAPFGQALRTKSNSRKGKEKEKEGSAVHPGGFTSQELMNLLEGTNELEEVEVEVNCFRLTSSSSWN